MACQDEEGEENKGGNDEERGGTLALIRGS
jgi:hypothetical protein